jgi:hypothetical protein
MPRRPAGKVRGKQTGTVMRGKGPKPVFQGVKCPGCGKIKCKC